MLKLYYADTLMPRKVCSVAQHVKAKVQYVPVDLKAGEHRGFSREQVVSIRDYRYVPYIAQDAHFVPGREPS